MPDAPRQSNASKGETLLVWLQANPIVIWIAVLFAACVINHSLKLPSEQIAAMGAFAFVPLFLVLSLQWIPAALWKVSLSSVLLMVAVAFPIHLILLLLPGLHSIHQMVNSESAVLDKIGWFLGAGAEEVCKIVPFLILYRKLARIENNAVAGFFTGWFSGMAFGFLEAIVTSGSMDPLSEGADIRRALQMVIGKSLFFPLIHAVLGGISALFIVRAFQSGRLFRQVLLGLTIAALFHTTVNILVPFRPLIGLLMLVFLGIGYAKLQKSQAPNEF